MKDVVKKYLDCIEEIINIPFLISCFTAVSQKDGAMLVLEEIIRQSKVEFNYDDEE